MESPHQAAVTLLLLPFSLLKYLNCLAHGEEELTSLFTLTRHPRQRQRWETKQYSRCKSTVSCPLMRFQKARPVKSGVCTGSPSPHLNCPAELHACSTPFQRQTHLAVPCSQSNLPTPHPQNEARLIGQRKRAALPRGVSSGTADTSLSSPHEKIKTWQCMKEDGSNT